MCIGVDIIAILKRPAEEDALILVSQFRPPMNAYCLEFPAGLMADADETPGEVAIRELKEETGYVASDCRVIEDVLCLDPGLSNATMNYCLVNVDGSDPRNINPIPDLQDEECIQVHLFPLGKDLYSRLSQLCQEHKMILDARLASFAFGLSFKI